MAVSSALQLPGLRLIGTNVLVSDLESGNAITQGGIIILDDVGKDKGIRARWAKVHSVGPEVTDLSPGEWVYIQHGRWTQGMDIEFPDGRVRLWKIDYPDAILLTADEDPRLRSF